MWRPLQHLILWQVLDDCLRWGPETPFKDLKCSTYALLGYYIDSLCNIHSSYKSKLIASRSVGLSSFRT